MSIAACDADRSAGTERRIDGSVDAPQSPLGPAQDEQADDSPQEGCALPVAGSHLRLEWLDVAATDKLAASLDEAAADLRVTNERDEAVLVRLDATGHRGTTRTLTSDLDSIELDPHESAVVHVDLDPYLEGDSPYSRAVVIGAFSEDPTTGKRLEAAVGPGLFFHELPGGNLAAYNEQVLVDTFRGGDYDAVTDASLDAEGVTDTIVQWEAPVVAAPLLEAEALPAEEPRASADADFPLVTPREARGAELYTICVELKVRHDDSGFTNTQGIDEDVWEDTDVNSLVPATGMLIKLDGTPYDLSESGCVSVWHAAPWTATVQVYTRSTRPDGAYVRMHDAPPCSLYTVPNCADPSGEIGSDYVWTATDVELDQPGTNTIEAGSYSTRRWTTIASFAKALERYHDELPSDTHIHISDQKDCDPDSMCTPTTEYCCICTDNNNYHNDPTNKDSYIYMASYQCSTDDLRKKFVAAHECGHAYIHQIAGIETQVPATKTLDVDSDCPDDSDGSIYNPYKNYTIEWSSIAFREGWAHFYAARVWNNRGADGQFRWGSENYDLEAYNEDDIPEGTEPGGHLQNVCCISLDESECATETAGAGVIPDWMRGLWDLHTTLDGETCENQPTRGDMANIAGDLLNWSELDDDNFFTALWFVLYLQSDDCDDLWEDIGAHNGLDH